MPFQCQCFVVYARNLGSGIYSTGAWVRQRLIVGSSNCSVPVLPLRVWFSAPNPSLQLNESVASRRLGLQDEWGIPFPRWFVLMATLASLWVGDKSRPRVTDRSTCQQKKPATAKPLLAKIRSINRLITPCQCRGGQHRADQLNC